MAGLLVVWLAAAFKHPRAWVFAIPALAPVLNFAPWTGWIVFEEFDLLVLGAAAAGYARWLLAAPSPSPGRLGSLGMWGAVVVLLTALSMALGFDDAGGLWFGWFQGYVDPLNSFRLAKPVFWACLLAPLLAEQLRTAESATLRLFASGMVCGLVVVSAAALWERAAYPGVWEFTQRYRTVALFWEMHVGGAAIDSYLALAMPFVLWALWSARRPLHWGMAAALALVAAYACLTTFSRGLYAALIVSSILLGALAWPRRPAQALAASEPRGRYWGDAALAAAGLALLAVVFDRHGAAVGSAVAVALATSGGMLRRWQPGGWRTPASVALVLAVGLEVLVVFGPGSFMLDRLAASEQDSGNRWSHWRNGVEILSTPADWAWGIGLGRLPAHYASQAPGGEFSGAVRPPESTGGKGAAIRLSGPRTRSELGGLYRLTQRVPPRSDYGLQFDARGIPGTVVDVRVCQSHLLYESRCQTAALVLAGPQTEWQRPTLTLHGRAGAARVRWPPRQAVFDVSVSSAGGWAEVSNFRLDAPDGASLLRNGDFSEGLAHWLPSATRYFVPWHIDSLLLEVLIERGVVSVIALGGLLAVAIGRFWHTRRRAPLSAVMLASLTAWLVVGMVNSVLDVPRVSLLAMLIVVCGVVTGERGGGHVPAFRPRATWWNAQRTHNHDLDAMRQPPAFMRRHFLQSRESHPAVPRRPLPQTRGMLACCEGAPHRRRDSESRIRPG